MAIGIDYRILSSGWHLDWTILALERMNMVHSFVLLKMRGKVVEEGLSVLIACQDGGRIN